MQSRWIRARFVRLWLTVTSKIWMLVSRWPGVRTELFTNTLAAVFPSLQRADRSPNLKLKFSMKMAVFVISTAWLYEQICDILYRLLVLERLTSQRCVQFNQKFTENVLLTLKISGGSNHRPSDWLTSARPLNLKLTFYPSDLSHLFISSSFSILCLIILPAAVSVHQWGQHI